MKNFFHKLNAKTWVLLIISIMVGLIFYSSLPDQIPIHFNALGEIDRYGSKGYIFLAPITIFIILILAEIFKRIDPKRETYVQSKKHYYTIYFAVSVLMFAMQLYTLWICFFPKESFNISHMMPIAMGILFTILGNIMPKFKSNFYVGIRTSWALSNEEVWYKTHRFAGKIWFIGGLLIMLTVFLPLNWIFIAFFIITIFMVIIPAFYSYITYLKVTSSARQ